MVDLTVDPEDVSPNTSSLSPGTSRGMFGIQHIPKHDTVKLTESTYLLWKHQVALIIDGYGLLRFIYAGSVAPDEFITNAYGELEENPVGSASLDRTYNCNVNLEYYISEYLAKVKSICDLLNASGSVVTEQEHSNVVDCEARQKMFLSENFSANLALHSREGAATETGSCGTQDVNTGSSQDHSSRGQSNGYRGRCRGRNNNRPQCQLCGRFGHVVQKCYHRFDRDYTGVSGSESMQENGSKPTGAGNSAKHSQSSGQPYAHTITSMPSRSNFVPTPFYFPSPYAPGYYPFPGFSPSFASNISCGSHGTSPSFLTPSSAAYASPVPTDSRTCSSASTDSLWYPDTGATHHVTNDIFVFQSGTLYTGGNSLLMGNGDGIPIAHDARTQVVLLQGRLTNDGLYQLLSCEDQRSSYLVNNVSKSPVSLKLWHQRLGHPSLDIVQRVLRSCSFVFNKTEAVNVCSACMQGKSHKLPFCKSLTKYNELFQLVVSDVWGPAPVCSTDGFRYYVSFVDVCSRYTWMYLLKRKSEVAQCLLDFAKFVEVQFGYKIKALHSYGGGEYQSLRKWLCANGVEHCHSCPGTSEQNGKAERKHRHIVETRLTMLA
ncbi:uncharacterized protein LOC120211068 [Hibiscus syriacus]|uniref:uncharacterized protein LOC120211068 n=1 Tax=Hibiscus syriacus TaxID=106335 RepID=UPI0019243E50|nr:uncharacterized protein LOC120211068 [Hibiscus syriacus]